MSATGTVLVTGAGGHLGPRIARLLSARSFTLAINDIDEQSAGLLAESIVGAVPFPADVSDDEAASRRRSAVDTGRWHRAFPAGLAVGGEGGEGHCGPSGDPRGGPGVVTGRMRDCWALIFPSVVSRSGSFVSRQQTPGDPRTERAGCVPTAKEPTRCAQPPTNSEISRYCCSIASTFGSVE